MEMAEKYLIVKGCAGLGNRVSTLCSAIEYAKETHRTLLVDWGDGEIVAEGYNFFNDYFSLKDVPHLTSYTPIVQQKNLRYYPDVQGCDITAGTFRLFDQCKSDRLPRIPFHRLPKNKIRTFRRHWRVKEREGVKCANKRFLLLDDKVLPYGGDMSKRLKHDVVFYLDFIPSFSRKTMERHVRLKDPIHSRINRFLLNELDGGRALGVHIRATDKKPEREINDLVAYLRSLDKDNVSIFLSTDNIDLQRQLMQVIEAIKVFPKQLPRVASGGIHQWSVRNKDHTKAVELLESSIIDMYLLSTCEYLLFQGNSSFSRIAALMHGNPGKAMDWNAHRKFSNLSFDTGTTTLAYKL